VRNLGRLLMIALIGGVGLALAIVLFAVPVNAMINGSTSSIPSPLLDIFKQQAEVSTVYAADGSVLAVLSAVENRTPVTLAVVPQSLIDAVVDTEDARFFTHGGVDVKSTVRALASDVKSGATVQGASTITQQLVKNLLNTTEKTLSRKIKDAVISDRLEQRYTKNQILEAYLNTVYFGNGAYGVQAAAQTYFDEDVSKVTTVQGALLAGMIRDPEGYDPILNPNDSRARRNFVLQRMVSQGDLSQSEATTLSAAPIPTAVSGPQGTADTKDDYYVEQVKTILLDQSTTLGSTYSERYDTLFEGGLKIYTNLVPADQVDAEQAVAGDIPAIVTKHGFSGALASLDPSTGQVVALVGGPDYDTTKFDLATSGLRQPGSGFKLFTLLAAYEAGYGPYDTVDGSSPCAVAFPGNNSLLKSPIHNDGDSGNVGEGPVPISVISATANSVNCAFIRIAHQVGLPAVVAMAHRLGLSETFPLNPSLVIGSEETTVLEMAAAYATVADDGVYHQPSFINKIVDGSGDTVYTADTAGKRVLSQQIAREAVLTLRAVVQDGTGTGAALPGRQVAGKTGTTEDNTDGWFNGFTPQLATTVWMGDPNGRAPMIPPNTPIDVFGGTYPATIWHTYTAAALTGLPAINFPTPNPGQIPGGKLISSPGLLADEPNEATSASTSAPSTSTSLPIGPVVTPPTSPSTAPTRTTQPTSGPPPTPPSTSCITPPNIPGRTFPSPPFCP
jgi:membrane peptidoglycan carboxypeptidase